MVVLIQIVFDKAAADECDADWKPMWPHGGFDCQRFSDQEWCKKDGDHYGDKWDFLSYGTFDAFPDYKGRTALVCPQCGCQLDDCKEVLPDNFLEKLSGVERAWNYKMKCEWIDGGWWIFFQQNAHYDKIQLNPFYGQTWSNFVNGFWQQPDSQRKEVFWLGLKHLSSITATGKWQLLAKVRWNRTFGGVEAGTDGWAVWRDFQVGGRENGYRLKVGGMIKYSNIPSRTNSSSYPSSAGRMSEDGKVFDPLYFHRDSKFSAPDNANGDIYVCAETYNTGWWFSQCHNLNLNRNPGRWFDGANLHFPTESIMALRIEA